MPESTDPSTYEIGSLLSRLRKEGTQRVKLALCDIDGVLRGKYLSFHKFAKVLESAGGYCDCVLGWDVNDELYDNVEFTGWHTGYPDALFRLAPETERLIPGENVPFFLGEFVAPDGKALHPICPRSLLKRVLGLAEEMGYGVVASAEYEFFVFAETPHSVREKGFRNLKPLTPGMFGYSTLRNSVHSELFNGLMDYCQALGIPIEGLHCETGPGVWEAAIAHTDALAAADRAVLFKTFAKVFFQKHECMATFMAKCSMDYPGQSGHLHQSLIDKKTGKPVFHNADGRFQMSDTMEHYLGGVQKYLRAFLCMVAPTINDYTRLVKGAWAPTASTWGCENRTTGIRVISGSSSSQRLELRVASAAANPYLALAASLGAGLLGIREKCRPENPITGNAYAHQESLPQGLRFPGNLRDAIAPLRESGAAREIFGEAFVDHFCATREWEVRQYEKTVTDWQLKRYFEII